MKNSKKIMAVIILVLLLLGVTVGYSVLTTSLNISGISKIKNATWDVHFSNIRVTTGSVTPVSAPAISENGLTITYDVDLMVPGDFYEFTVDVVNSGTIDAELVSDPEITGVSTEQDAFVNYTFLDSNGDPVVEGTEIRAGRTKKYRVRVEFDRDIDETILNTISSDETMNLKVKMNWQQAS